MKACQVCAHRVHIPGKCAGAMANGTTCPCPGPKATEIPLELAREMLARKARNRASKKAGDAWESEIIAKAKAEGWLVHHVRPAKTAKGWRSPISGHKGFPDIALVHPARGTFFVVEAKTGAATLSKEQNEWRQALVRARVYYCVWHPEMRDAIYKTLEGRG